MKKIILDTNFLLIPGKFKVDIFSEIDKVVHFNYGLFVVSATITELRKLSSSKELGSNDRQNAKMALDMIERKKIKIIDCEEDYADDAIVKVSDEDTIVATADTELKHRLVEKKVPILALKQRKYLILQKDV